jgi:hypothetical protein
MDLQLAVNVLYVERVLLLMSSSKAADFITMFFHEQFEQS